MSETTTIEPLTREGCLQKAAKMITAGTIDVADAWRRLADSLPDDRAANEVALLRKTLTAVIATGISGRIIETAEVEARTAALVVGFALVRPTTEILLASDDDDAVQAMGAAVEKAVLAAGAAPGRSSITHQPFLVNLPNGSRIIGRRPRRDGAGIQGLHPNVVWWTGPMSETSVTEVHQMIMRSETSNA